MHWIYLIHKFHNLSWITEINELFHDIQIYWDAPVISSTTVVNIANNKKWFLSTKSAYYNDHVMLKPEVMMLKIQIHHHRNKVHF